MEHKKHMNAKSDGTFGRIMAASAVVDITPKNTQFLHGYLCQIFFRIAFQTYTDIITHSFEISVAFGRVAQ